ncbi:hypothetical protein Ahy_B01g053540 [Arachis hypogaea]|uniref:Transposase MuDR plant domain-containing protein n=1 Tax=Arachis hypogaea TaxID=3818 RepID=A0A445ARX7_ARAHY|nr:hypothetical protein Ahy_B01g053540 [Arachis hypogaea]
MVEDDGHVCADSGSEDDARFFGPIPRFGSMGTYDDAQDKGYEKSDGGDSWHSEELKTPPNSEDELEEVDSDEVFPVFRDGCRFGELRLAVEMTFTIKMEFKEAVREYYIQEGQRIWFKKNDNRNCEKRATDEVAAAGAAAVQPPAANGLASSCVRPPKLPPKRKSSKQEKATPGSSSQAATTPPAPTPPATSQPTTLPPSHPMQGASQGTVTRLFNFMKFVPNPGFRQPRNKK